MEHAVVTREQVLEAGRLRDAAMVSDEAVAGGDTGVAEEEGGAAEAPAAAAAAAGDS